jgi:hypothetical protein
LLRPFRIADDSLEFDDKIPAVKQIADARETIITQRSQYLEALKIFDQADNTFIQTEQAMALLDAGFSIDDTLFGVPMGTPGKIQQALRSAQGRSNASVTQMHTLESALARRMLAGLRSMEIPQIAEKIPGATFFQEEIPVLLQAQRVLVDIHPMILGYRNTGFGLRMLVSQLESHKNMPSLIAVINSRMTQMHNQLSDILKRLVLEKYPLDHAKTDISIAEYLLAKLPTNEDLSGLLNSSAELLEKLATLSAKVACRLTAIAEEIETALGFPPLPEPPEEKPS